MHRHNRLNCCWRCITMVFFLLDISFISYTESISTFNAHNNCISSRKKSTWVFWLGICHFQLKCLFTREHRFYAYREEELWLFSLLLFCYCLYFLWSVILLSLYYYFYFCFILLVLYINHSLSCSNWRGFSEETTKPKPRITTSVGLSPIMLMALGVTCF